MVEVLSGIPQRTRMVVVGCWVCLGLNVGGDTAGRGNDGRFRSCSAAADDSRADRGDGALQQEGGRERSGLPADRQLRCAARPRPGEQRRPHPQRERLSVSERIDVIQGRLEAHINTFVSALPESSSDS